MPKGNATISAQWLEIRDENVVVVKTGLMASKEMTKNVEKAIEKLIAGETVYIDPFDRLLTRIKDLWQAQKQDQSVSTLLSPVPSEQAGESAGNLPMQPGPGEPNGK